jgi:hypothetical protein
LFSASDPSNVFAMANAGYDFIWTEMQHDQRDWAACANVAHVSAREGRARRARRLHRRARESSTRSMPARWSLVVPTVDTVGEAIEARNWAYFPPLGRRSNGGGRRSTRRCGAACPAAIATRSTTTSSDPDDRNARGLKNARIREGARGQRGLRRERRPRNFSGYPAGHADYERRSTSCTMRRSRPGVKFVRPFRVARSSRLHVFQAGVETARLRAGRCGVGNPRDTQGQPEVGPFAKKPQE